MTETLFNNTLPTSFLRFNDVIWNVGAFCAHDKMFSEFYDMIKGETGETLMTSVHGCPPISWNGGRTTQKLSKTEIHNCLEIFQQRSIPIYLTFSNCAITTESLSDRMSNYMLDLIADTENAGVIVCEDILSKYIRDKYPHLKQISSIIRTEIYGKPGNSEYYNEVSQIFDKVVLAVDDGYNFDLLKRLHNKNKFEVMVNDICIRKCPYRRKHRLMGHIIGHREADRRDELAAFEAIYCANPDVSKTRKIAHTYIGGENEARRPLVEFSMDEVNQVYDMGFKYLKLQGRWHPPAAFMHYLCHYILNDKIAPYFYHHFTNDM